METKYAALAVKTFAASEKLLAFAAEQTAKSDMIAMCYMRCDMLYALRCVICVAICYMRCDMLYALRCVLCVAICYMRCDMLHALRYVIRVAICYMHCDMSRNVLRYALPYVPICVAIWYVSYMRCVMSSRFAAESGCRAAPV
jgi:hypothetical protein